MIDIRKFVNKIYAVTINAQASPTLMDQNNLIFLSCDYLFGSFVQQYSVSIFPLPNFDICIVNLYSRKLYWFQDEPGSKWNLSNNY